MTKTLWLDVETTGIDQTLHSIIQIAGIIDIDGEEKHSFCYDVKPHRDFEIDEDAMKVNKISIKMMSNFPEIEMIHSRLKKDFGKFVNPYDKTDKYVIAGQKISFDLDFLSHFFMRQGDNFLGSWIDFKNRIDLLDITRGMRALGFIKSDKVNLTSLCKEFGVEIKAHNAGSDIRATRELYYLFKNNTKFSIN